MIERELRKMDIFSFLSRILAEIESQKNKRSDLEDEPFGGK
jgi:hypothetical protein